MNFERCNLKVSLLEDYYNHFDEEHRLKTRHGNVEFITHITYLDEYIKEGTTLLDLGAGTGVYSIYYKNKNVDVTALELVKHNLDQIKEKNKDIKCILGNAINLSMLEDKSFDNILVFGPMYHLLNEDDKLTCLNEAKRVLKDDGHIFISYYMNDYAILTYGFIKGHILESINEGRVDNNYHMIPLDGDLYSMVRIEDIDKYNKLCSLKRIKLIASTGPSNYIRVELNKLSNEQYEEFIKYHLSICERIELLGASSHLLDIVVKDNK